MNASFHHWLLGLVFLLAGLGSQPQSGLAADCTPQICLSAVSDALERADAGSFEQHVDIDAILNHAQADFLAAMREAGTELSPLLSLALSQPAGVHTPANPLLSILKSEFRAFVLNGVSSGAFGGKAQPGSPESKGLIAPLFADVSKARKVLRACDTPARRLGNDWLMPFELFDEGNHETYRIVGRFSDAAGACRLIAIENMSELIQRLLEESRALD